jgi:hypothetical protein
MPVEAEAANSEKALPIGTESNNGCVEVKSRLFLGGCESGEFRNARMIGW